MARLLRPRGNKGELAAESLSSRSFGDLESVLIKGVSHRIENTWMHGDKLILKFAGIDSISAAEGLAGAEVQIPKEARAALGEDEYYLTDLVGCQVVDSAGREIGPVDGWEEYGPTPLLRVGELMIPFARAICKEIDVPGRRILVDLPEGLRDLNPQ